MSCILWLPTTVLTAELGTPCRAHWLDKLCTASEMQRPTCTVGERKKLQLLKLLYILETVKISISPGAGSVVSHRHCHYNCHCYYTEKRVLIFGVYVSFPESVLYLYCCSAVSTEMCWLHSYVNQEKERRENPGLPLVQYKGRAGVLQFQNSMLGINGNSGDVMLLILKF